VKIDEPLNGGVYRVHRIFAIICAALIALMALIGFGAIQDSLKTGESLWASIGRILISSILVCVLVMPLFALHWYGMKGARLGTPYGRTLSRIAATIWLLGFPIGTAVAIYVFSATGKNWKSGMAP
jgi:hypothetical protein